MWGVVGGGGGGAAYGGQSTGQSGALCKTPRKRLLSSDVSDHSHLPIACEKFPISTSTTPRGLSPLEGVSTRATLCDTIEDSSVETNTKCWLQRGRGWITGNCVESLAPKRDSGAGTCHMGGPLKSFL